jgi:hypothetical protein
MPWRAKLFAILISALLNVPLWAASPVPLWTRFEASFTSARHYENPVQDVQVDVEFTGPNGEQRTAAAFWDGGQIWRVRFSPDQEGKWTYRTQSTPADDSGLNGQAGEFTCVAYSGQNPLYRHGTLRLAENRRHLEQADGTPFFWLSDTAWNGALKADERGWETYLTDRSAKGFTAVQFVTTQWLAAAGNADLRLAYLGREKISIDPEFFRWMDQRVDALNAHGLIAAPVLIWAAHWNPRTLDLNPGTSLPDDQIIVLARYMVARYGAHQVIWILAGDSDYRGERAERWRRIGSAVFGDHPARLATMHPAGKTWVGGEFRSEPWYSFIGYQSGHGDSDADLRWLTEGPPSQQWRAAPVLPIINLEPNYEGHRGYTHRKPFDAHAVRRAAYWSLLVSPPAGVSYGAHGIWSWELSPEVPMNHPSTGVALPWFEAMKLPGSTSMKHLKALFSSLDWWTLLPDQELIAEQPGVVSPQDFIAAARSEDGSLALVYIPEGGKVTLKMEGMKLPVTAQWFDPATGLRSNAGEVRAGGRQTFDAHTKEDRVLILRHAGKQEE